ncbi:hypothetical protein [Lysobacter gummosus]|uniref:hypothetical protein n=1 Tax=Lysobacter gummosus TaxID=262324 RepID=UPI0036451DC6
MWKCWRSSTADRAIAPLRSVGRARKWLACRARPHRNLHLNESASCLDADRSSAQA